MSAGPLPGAGASHITVNRDAWHSQANWENEHCWMSGFAAGWAAARLSEREAIREALAPDAPDLRAAISTHLREVEQRNARWTEDHLARAKRS